LYKSIYSPKEIAKYRFLPIGKAVQHVFLIAFLITLGGAAEKIGNDGLFSSDTAEMMGDAITQGFFTAIFFLVSFGLNAGLLFLAISLIAAIGEPAAKWQERKLPYRQSWRVAAFSLTFPAVLFGILYLLGFQDPLFMLLALGTAIAIMLLSIRFIPKPRRTK
jgi:hypothetical protein